MNAQVRVFLLLFLLATCGAQAATKVACVGDSITEGVGARDRRTQTYPAQLAAMLGDGYEVKNCGTSGIMMKNYLGHQGGKWRKEITAFQPDVVTIKLGTNDTKSRRPGDAADKVKFHDSFKASSLGLLEFLNGLESKPTIYLCYPVPVFQDKWGINEKAIVEDIIPTISEMAKENKLPVIDLYKVLEGKGNLVPDGVHPNAEAYTLLAQTIADVVTGKAKPLTPGGAPEAEAVAVPEMRSWTSTSGSTIEAQLIKHYASTVTLKTSKGKTIRLSMSKLSKADQDYVKALVK